MSFRDTKTPTKPTAKAKWQVPMRQHPTQGVPEWQRYGEYFKTEGGKEADND